MLESDASAQSVAITKQIPNSNSRIKNLVFADLDHVEGDLDYDELVSQSILYLIRNLYGLFATTEIIRLSRCRSYSYWLLMIGTSHGSL